MTGRGPFEVDTVVLDIDGTLLDSNYHHTVAWLRAFAAHGHQVDGWRVHRAIGMGGDRLVGEVAGDRVEAEDGDGIRDRWEQEFDTMIGSTTLLPRARDLLDALAERGFAVVLASSSIPAHAEHALDLLGADQRVAGWTTAEDAEDSKPDPELVEAALAKVDADRAVLVGDTVWDVAAGLAAGVPTIGVRSGGISSSELTEAGAALVLEDVAELVDRLDEVLVPGSRG